MTTFTTEDRLNATTKIAKHYTDHKGSSYEVLAIWNPNEENDPWVRYRNPELDKEYTCRLEAFLSRFDPIPE
jgi:hypothetical protein